MAAFRIRHPTDALTYAWYGWDQAIGFFVEVRRARGVVATYDAVSDADHSTRPFEGALRFLACVGFFTAEEIGEALRCGQAELPEEVPAAIARIARVVANFKKAAG
jgi:hypothetical protein